METRTGVVLVLVALALAGGLVFSYVAGPRLQEMGLQTASDVGRIKGTIAVGGDNYLGYWFLTSRELTNRLRQRGYLIHFTNDQGDYAERHRKFAEGRYEIMVLPINSYLLHGLGHRYPGVIPVALSESKGADSIVGYADKVAPAGRQPTVNDLNNPSLKFCVTPDSPSEFLLNVAIAHFALDDLKKQGRWSVATKGSEDAYARLRGRQCDVAVLWEPDVSRALAIPGVAAVFGSDQVSEMIVDVFVLRRQWVKEQPEAVDAFFQSYFDTVSYYAGYRDQMLAELAKDPALGSTEAADRALSRIAWFGLDDNCRDWFNVGLPGVAPLQSREKLVDTIAQVISVMVRVGELARDPVGGNPYTITNTEVLGRLCSQIAGAGLGIGVGPAGFPFPALSEEEWSALRPVGRLRMLPISFDASTARLTREGAAVANQVGVALVHNYPQYRVLVKGHTAPSGDEAANQDLSETRAEAVKTHLIASQGIDTGRVHAVGVGSREPLPRLPGEGELAYRNRLARVEFMLVEDRR